MALAARLRVVERSETVRDLLDLVELRQIRLVRRLVDHTITAVVEARGCLYGWSRSNSGSRRHGESQGETQNRQRDHSVHGFLSSRHLPASPSRSCLIRSLLAIPAKGQRRPLEL